MVSSLIVWPLKLADEIKVATDCLEGAGGIFTADHPIALIQKRASEGLMLPSTAAACIATQPNAISGSAKAPTHVGRNAAGHMTQNLKAVLILC